MSVKFSKVLGIVLGTLASVVLWQGFYWLTPVTFELTVMPQGLERQAFTDGCKLRPEAESTLGTLTLFETSANVNQAQPIDVQNVKWSEVMTEHEHFYCMGVAKFTIHRGHNYAVTAANNAWDENYVFRFSSKNLNTYFGQIWELNYAIKKELRLSLDLVGYQQPCVRLGQPVHLCSAIAMPTISIDKQYQECSGSGSLDSFNVTIRGKSTGLEHKIGGLPQTNAWTLLPKDARMGNEPVVLCRLEYMNSIPFDPEGYTLLVPRWGKLEYSLDELESSGWVISVRNTENSLQKQ